MRAEELKRRALECCCDALERQSEDIPRKHMYVFWKGKNLLYWGGIPVRMSRRILRIHRKYFPVRQ